MTHADLQVVILVVVTIFYPSETELRMPIHTEPYVELTCVQDKLPFLLPLIYNIISILVCAVLGYRFE